MIESKSYGTPFVVANTGEIVRKFFKNPKLLNNDEPYVHYTCMYA